MEPEKVEGAEAEATETEKVEGAPEGTVPTEDGDKGAE
jgi:hypothetical protein